MKSELIPNQTNVQYNLWGQFIREDQYKPVKRVLWAVLIANLTITAVKIFLGAITGSLAVVADGFHSLVNSSSNLIGLAAIRLAGRPADERYPYGYQRFETIGALGIGGLLLVAAWEIVKSVFEGFPRVPSLRSLGLLLASSL